MSAVDPERTLEWLYKAHGRNSNIREGSVKGR
jgi:hypothetical protein